MRRTIMAQILERIISFIWESCRLILLLGSITLAFMSILIIGSLLYFREVFNFLNEHDYWPRNYTIWLILTAVYLILLSIIGCTGSLYKQRRFIKLVSSSVPFRLTPSYSGLTPEIGPHSLRGSSVLITHYSLLITRNVIV